MSATPNSSSSRNLMAEPARSASGAWLSALELNKEGQAPSLVTIEIATQHSLALGATVVGSAKWSPAQDRLAYVTPEGAAISNADGSGSLSWRALQASSGVATERNWRMPGMTLCGLLMLTAQMPVSSTFRCRMRPA